MTTTNTPNAGQHTDRLTAAERRRQALDLRRTGASFRQIAEAIGCSVSIAHRYVATEIDKLNRESREDAESIRTLELERLDRMTFALWNAATARGNLGAIDRMLKVMERRARLLGLDAPAKFPRFPSSQGQGGDYGDEQSPGVVVLPAYIESLDEWRQRFSPPAE